MRRERNAKILATLGPGSSSAETIAALFHAGADVFRFNLSHGSHADHARRFEIVRSLEAETGRPIAILVDLQGPKLRIGKFASGPVDLTPGQSFRVDLDPTPGTAQRVHLPHPEVLSVLREGADLLLDDGKVRLRVEAAHGDAADTTVVAGTRLSDNKGLNLPGLVLPLSALTAKDRRDLTLALELGADWIGLSFVQRPEDVAELRKLVAGRAAIISKLEKPSAIDHLDEIIDLSDAIMVARGDLGVEVPPETVPALQKRIVRHCRHAGKPVVVATQMLESMVNAPAPTRAEASDVATAIYDGADAVMLSAETAVGAYPIDAVAMMDKIIRQTERDEFYRRVTDASREEPQGTAPDAISAAARQVAHTIGAAVIVTFTSSGSTTLRAARERPDVPIICLTANHRVARRMCMTWGVHGIPCADIHSVAEMVEQATGYARDEGFAQPGQRVVITAGVPFATPGTTNLLRIAWVGRAEGRSPSG